MLRDEDIRIDIGAASHGGDFTRMVHIPSGIERLDPGPLKGVNVHEMRKRWRAEMLVGRGTINLDIGGAE